MSCAWRLATSAAQMAPIPGGDAAERYDQGEERFHFNEPPCPSLFARLSMWERRTAVNRSLFTERPRMCVLGKFAAVLRPLAGGRVRLAFTSARVAPP